jgi:hypothetical protein
VTNSYFLSQQVCQLRASWQKTFMNSRHASAQQQFSAMTVEDIMLDPCHPMLPQQDRHKEGG